MKSGRYPRIKAMSYWHQNWKNDGSTSNLRLDSSPKALAAYREEIADPFFVTGAHVVATSQSTTFQTTTTAVLTAESITSGETTVLKNPSVEVTIRGVTRKMTADSEQATVRNLYQRKYPLARLSHKIASLLKTGGETQPIFEFKPE